MTRDPLVSIITPAFNSQDFIADTIESVLAQSYADWEMIIVDDCSSDRTVDIVRAYAENDRRIRLLSLEKNGGAAKARSAALDAAQGRYVAFLDSDDIWLPEKLSKQVRFMRETGSAFTFTAYKKMDEKGKISGSTVTVPEIVCYKDLLDSSLIGCLTVLYDKEQVGEVVHTDIMLRNDYALWLAIMKKIQSAHGLNEPLAVYRVRKSSLSGNKLKAGMYQWKIYREVEKLPFCLSMKHFVIYAVKGYLKFRS